MDADRCVICGEIIPEGVMICPICESKYIVDRIDEQYIKLISIKKHKSRIISEIVRFINVLLNKILK